MKYTLWELHICAFKTKAWTMQIRLLDKSKTKKPCIEHKTWIEGVFVNLWIRWGEGHVICRAPSCSLEAGNLLYNLTPPSLTCSSPPGYFPPNLLALVEQFILAHQAIGKWFFWGIDSVWCIFTDWTIERMLQEKFNVPKMHFCTPFIYLKVH